MQVMISQASLGGLAQLGSSLPRGVGRSLYSAAVKAVLEGPKSLLPYVWYLSTSPHGLSAWLVGALAQHCGLTVVVLPQLAGLQEREGRSCWSA